MKFRHTSTTGNDKIELNMTSMIDIVFQLLVFFIMTLKIVAQEGDFNVRMPMASQTPSNTLDVPPDTIIVRLEANPDGSLQAIKLNDQSLQSFDALNQRIIEQVQAVGPELADSKEVELGFDYNLRYSHVVEAMTAISGYVQDGKVVKLIEKIKFAAPDAPPAG